MKLLTNPRFAVLSLIFIVFLGVKASLQMPKELYPDLEVPILMIVSVYPGAPPELVEVRVTDILERQLKSLPSIVTLKSSSIESASIVLVEFDVSANYEECYRLTKEAVDSAKGDLPSEVEQIDIIKARTTNSPAITLNLITNNDPREVSKISDMIKENLEGISGVSEVRVSGLREEQVQVLLNRHRMAQIGANLNDVVLSLQAAQKEAPLGRMQTASHNYPLQVKRIGLDMDRLRLLPVRSSATGESVALQDVATVKRALAEPTQFSQFVQLGEQTKVLDTVTFDVLRQPGGNLIEIADAVQEAVEKIRERLPNGTTLLVTMDQSIDVRDSISLLVNNGVQAVLLVFAVLFFFLGVRESLIAGLSIPVTFLATLATLQVIGYSVNSLTLMALVIGLGILVDNFILVMEGMHEKIHEGIPPAEAAMHTLKTYGLPILSGTATTVAAFAPMAQLGGINGRFVRVLPVTVSITLTMSLIISMSLCLAVGTAFLRKHEANPLTRATDRMLERLSAFYYDALALKVFGTKTRRVIWAGGSVILLGIGAYLHTFTEKILYPDIKSPTIGATLYLPAGSNLSETRKLSKKVIALLSKEKDMIKQFTITAGQLSSLAYTSPEAFLEPFEGENILGLAIELRPEEERDRTSYEYARELRQKLESIHDGKVEIHEKRLAPRGGYPVEVEVTGDDPARVDALAKAVREIMEGMPELTGIGDNLKEHSAGFQIVLDDRALKHHNLSRTEALLYLRSAIEGQDAATVTEGDQSIDIVVAYDWRDDGVWNSPTSMAEIKSMLVSGFFSDTSVPLAALGTVELATSPYGINHSMRKYSVLLKAEHRSGSPVEIGIQLEKKLKKALHLQKGEAVTVLGDKAKNADVQEQIKVAGAIAVVAIFSILVMQFGSFTQPFIVMMAMPLSLLGVFYGFRIFDLAFSFPAMVGLVSLAGIVVNDAIVLIDTVNRLRADGMEMVAACRLGGRMRLRPILSTTITTVVGLLPLSFTDPVWQGLCLTIVFGLSVATILTLGVVPALYIILTPQSSADAPSPDVPSASAS